MKQKVLKIIAFWGVMMSKGRGIRHDPSVFKTSGHICKHCSFAHINNVLRPWSAFCTQKHSFQQNRKSTFTEAEKLTLCYSLGKQHLHAVTCRHKGRSSAPDLIPTTFPFSSCFWETSSTQKWVNNFCPPAHFDRPSSLQSTPRFQGQVTTLFTWSGEEKASQSPPHCGRQIHPSISSSLVLQGRSPPLHKGQLTPVWALLPYNHTGMEPYSSTICHLLKLTENLKACNRIW